jgi:acyl carrier protein
VNTLPALDELRGTIGEALGDDRLAGLDGDEALWTAGLISSLELVTIVLALEQRYQVRIQDSLVSPRNFASLNAIGRLLNSLTTDDAPPATAARSGLDSVKRVVSRPLTLVAAALAVSFCIDVGLRIVVGRAKMEYARFLEQGARLYPFSGAFSHDDFEFAVEQHAIRASPSHARVNVLVLGDSGTIGSYLPAREAIPSHLGRTLEERGSNLRSLNLAFFGRLLVKDLMLLELTLDDATRVVVFTVGAEYFKKAVVDRWIGTFPHPSFNWRMFQRFRRRIPPTEAAPFVAMEEALHDADLRHLGPLRRVLYAHSAMRYGPFLQYWLQVQIPPSEWGSPMKWDMLRVAEQRLCLEGPRFEVTDLVDPGELDERQITLLKSTIRYLRARDIGVVLWVEPAGPRSWRTTTGNGLPVAAIAEQVASETGAVVADASWSLDACDFLDSTAHYTSSANRSLGERLADPVLEAAGQ